MIALSLVMLGLLLRNAESLDSLAGCENLQAVQSADLWGIMRCTAAAFQGREAEKSKRWHLRSCVKAESVGAVQLGTNE